MPTYTYRCNNCNYQFDIRQRMADDPLADCPSCGTEQALRKVLNSVGIVFKGSGFYVTDNRGKKGAASSASNGKGDDNGSGESESSPAKPETANKESSSKAEKKSDGKAKTEKTAA